MYSLKEATKSTLQVTPGGPVNMVKSRAAIEGSSQAGGMGQQKPCKIQQGQMQSPAPGQEENLAQVGN